MHFHFNGNVKSMIWCYTSSLHTIRIFYSGINWGVFFFQRNNRTHRFSMQWTGTQEDQQQNVIVQLWMNKKNWNFFLCNCRYQTPRRAVNVAFNSLHAVNREKEKGALLAAITSHPNIRPNQAAVFKADASALKWNKTIHGRGMALNCDSWYPIPRSE